MESVSIILIMGVIKYFVSHARDEYGTSHIPQLHVSLVVTFMNSEVCKNTSKEFCFEWLKIVRSKIVWSKIVWSKIIRTTLIKQLKWLACKTGKRPLYPAKPERDRCARLMILDRLVAAIFLSLTSVNASLFSVFWNGKC